MSKDPKKDPKVVTEQINKSLFQQVDKDINRAYEDLFQKDANNYQLPEHVFVEKFLPFFAGQVHDDPRLNITTNWIAIAGSPMNAVDVTNPKGEVIFTVPPLMSTDFLKTSENIRGKSFNQIFTHAKLQSNRIPNLGDKIIGSEAAAKVAGMTVKQDSQEVMGWNNIFNRYGIPSPVPNAGGSVQQQTNKDNEDLVYD